MTFPHWVALITFGCFSVLTRYGYGVAEQWTPHRVLSNYGKPVVLWSKTLEQRQAEALATVYGITPENENSYREWW